MPNYAAMLQEKSKSVKTSMAKPDKDEGEPSIEAPKTTSDLNSDDWQAKLDCIKLGSDGKTPAKGEISRVARLAPRVPKETLRRRFWQQDISKTKTGPSPVMGSLEVAMLDWLNVYKGFGVRIYAAVVTEKARKLMADAKYPGTFKASRSWLIDFCKRHGLTIREGQFLEKERAHAVSRESMGRFYDNLEVATEGVAPEDIWMLDEVHVNLLECGGYKVSLFCASYPIAHMDYSNSKFLPFPTGYLLLRMMRGFPSRNHQSTSVLCPASTQLANKLLLLLYTKVYVPCLASLKTIQKYYWAWIQQVTCHVSCFLRGP